MPFPFVFASARDPEHPAEAAFDALELPYLRLVSDDHLDGLVERFGVSRGTLVAASALLYAAATVAKAQLGPELSRALVGPALHWPPIDGAEEPEQRAIGGLLWALLRSNRALGDAGAVLGGSAQAAEHVLEQANEATDSGDLRRGIQLLRAPLLAHPDSLGEQLDAALASWGPHLPEELRLRLRAARDWLDEERPRSGGAGPVALPSAGDFGPGATTEEHSGFSADRDWMPNLVVVAKNTLVWLDQLSRRFGRPIAHLDEVPDEALAELASYGFSGLWLIGIWRRSEASRTIKRRRGNSDAAASAYAISSYDVAPEIGGDAALARLREKLGAHGIRLGADMVPNHTGIDADWVIAHPERFVQLDGPAHPNHRYDGPDLSPDPGVRIQIEDGYWQETDAAVTFRREDLESGEVRFVYHGNDGTQMPWNDTAQLDFTRADVREAVRETILSVARRVDIIRFDAAMTLTRAHHQRLWHPTPGTGGAIPTRTRYGLSREAFEEAMPTEFWREVVDRAAEETPNTLLLAEAFWLTESYFVRVLGMHRVYNSAFMHMLASEENARYRAFLRQALDEGPEVLRRWVNFMSNPDEETARQQFGVGDKYFGVATLMATLPGLPMFGHGQVEGFEERYGMEFRRSYREESPDPALVARHREQLTPLLRSRALFAGVEHFALFDFCDGEEVRESVYCFVNGSEGERVLVLFNNQMERVSGRVTGSDAWGEARCWFTDARFDLSETVVLNGYQSRVLRLS